jgi:hypothetical protein
MTTINVHVHVHVLCHVLVHVHVFARKTKIGQLHFLSILGFYAYLLPVLPLRGQPAVLVLCHPRWQPTQELTKKHAEGWGGAGLEPGLLLCSQVRCH